MRDFLFIGGPRDGERLGIQTDELGRPMPYFRVVERTPPFEFTLTCTQYVSMPFAEGHERFWIFVYENLQKDPSVSIFRLLMDNYTPNAAKKVEKFKEMRQLISDLCHSVEQLHMMAGFAAAHPERLQWAQGAYNRAARWLTQNRED